jgi:hypothetical protein
LSWNNSGGSAIDGSQWRKIDRTYVGFALDARNIRFALSTDGMNPFSKMSSSHSTCPVTLCMYNLPPWLFMKRKSIMILVLILAPKQPGNDIDVYLRPLVEELLLLWHQEAVWMWDEYRHEKFNLRALLFVTINDWPALSNPLGQTNKGYRACTHCLDETDSIYLTHYRKVDEDITHLDAHNTSPLDIQGPITRAHARQLNLEVSSFLSTSTYDFENRLLPNDYIMIRNQGEDQEMHGEGLVGMEVQ